LKLKQIILEILKDKLALNWKFLSMCYTNCIRVYIILM